MVTALWIDMFVYRIMAPQRKSPRSEKLSHRELRRKNAYDLLLEGKQKSEIARKFGVSRVSVSKWSKRLQTDGYDS